MRTPNNALDLKLDQARRSAGLTWDQVAERAGISGQALRNIRSGAATPRPETAQTLDHALNLEPGTVSRLAQAKAPRPTTRPQELAFSCELDEQSPRVASWLMIRVDGIDLAQADPEQVAFVTRHLSVIAASLFDATRG